MDRVIFLAVEMKTTIVTHGDSGICGQVDSMDYVVEDLNKVGGGEHRHGVCGCPARIARD